MRKETPSACLGIIGTAGTAGDKETPMSEKEELINIGDRIARYLTKYTVGEAEFVYHHDEDGVGTVIWSYRFPGDDMPTGWGKVFSLPQIKSFQTKIEPTILHKLIYDLKDRNEKRDIVIELLIE